jgi:LacI family kdg operon repressor
VSTINAKKTAPTINDIAKLTGVSKTTVSRYLNGRYGKMSAETRTKITQAITETGYHVNRQAQAITKKQTFVIGVIVADVENIFSSMLFKGADAVFENQQYQLMLMNSDNSIARERSQIERLLSLRVDGLILQPMSKRAADYQILLDNHVPTVMVDRQVDQLNWPMVVTDNYHYSKLLVDYMIRLRYQKVIVVSEAVDDNTARQSRYHAVQDSCEKQGIPFELIEIDSTTSDEKLYSQLVAVTNDLQLKVAVYALKGTLLMRIVHILSTYSVEVPQSLGLAAFDDWDWATLTTPQITTIQQNPQLMGQRAAEVLLTTLSEPDTLPTTVQVPSEFIVRQSLI